MNEFVLSHEISIRLGVFFGMFFLVAVWELVARAGNSRYPK